MIYRFVIIAAVVTATTLAGCGGPQPPIGSLGALPQTLEKTSANGYAVLYSFASGNDGRQPQAPLINVGGTLYGTTYAGGSSDDGTVFSISTSGTEKVLYSFQGGNDGANPAAGLLATNGLLYGTTEYGGIPSYGSQCNAGTVFSITKGGMESVVYRFFGYYCHDHVYNDGANPVASLISVGGKLYGTTSSGGENEYYGTVFRVNGHGKEKVLHSFAPYGDGGTPETNLLNLDGVLYGTTKIYGPAESAGTIYSITSSGTENVLYIFPSEGQLGAGPAALIAVRGTLYGTTAYGGPYGTYFGSGTAFSMTPTGSLTTLHNFGSGTDGRHPYAPLLNVGGTLYGTTEQGGSYGDGTVFKMSLSGKEKVLHSFGYGSDGATPFAGLIDVKGTLYGTTSAGGTQGYGTVFAVRIK